VTGYLDNDLSVACNNALHLDRRRCRAYAESRSWSNATDQFVANLALRDPDRIRQARLSA
jgi:hypothetical protein